MQWRQVKLTCNCVGFDAVKCRTTVYSMSYLLAGTPLHDKPAPNCKSHLSRFVKRSKSCTDSLTLLGLQLQAYVRTSCGVCCKPASLADVISLQVPDLYQLFFFVTRRVHVSREAYADMHPCALKLQQRQGKDVRAQQPSFSGLHAHA